jgi:dATP/dGTP diphosphohydrolase
MSLPTDSKARKDIPMFSGLIAYFPDALAAVAQHSFDSNEKYNPGEPLHWSREKSSDHMDCIVRHTTDIAAGSDKITELKAIAWRSLAELQIELEAKARRGISPAPDQPR